MSDKASSKFSGTVLVRCNVVVRMSGDTGGDMTVMRGAAETTAMEQVEEALSTLGNKSPIDSAKVTTAEAAEMTIVWPGESE